MKSSVGALQRATSLVPRSDRAVRPSSKVLEHAIEAMLGCFILTVGIAIVVMSSPVRPVNAADPLEAYRALATSSQGAELLAFARGSMEHWFDGSAPDAKAAAIPDWPAAPVGVYVTLFDGATTRACVGSAAPVGGTLGETVRSLAAQALSADRRRPPVRRSELARLRVAIAFAGPGERVADPMLVQPASEGLLIASAAGSVAYLPGEARTVSWALRDARRSGLLTGRAQDASFQKFPVVVVKEPERPIAKELDASD